MIAATHRFSRNLISRAHGPPQEDQRPWCGAARAFRARGRARGLGSSCGAFGAAEEFQDVGALPDSAHPGADRRSGDSSGRPAGQDSGDVGGPSLLPETDVTAERSWVVIGSTGWSYLHPLLHGPHRFIYPQNPLLCPLHLSISSYLM